MIQGIDGMALINALRAGKQDRYENDKRVMDMHARQQEIAKQQQIRGLVGQVFGQPQTGGVAAMSGLGRETYAPTSTPSFDQAFGGDTIAALPGADQGGSLPALSQPSQPAQPAPHQGGVNMDALKQLSVIDPDMGGKIATAFKTMSETELKQADAKNMAMAQSAHYLATVPANERQQAFQNLVAPHLIEAGWTQDQIAKADLSDNGLRYYQMHGMDMDKLVASELAERKFMAGDNVGIQPGGAVINVKPDGTGSYVVKPYQMADQAPAAGITEGATATNPQTGAKIQFRGGQWVPMGGSGGNVTGGFQP